MAAAKLERHYITYASPTCTNYHCKSCTCGTTTYTTAVTHLTSLKLLESPLRLAPLTPNSSNLGSLRQDLLATGAPVHRNCVGAIEVTAGARDVENCTFPGHKHLGEHIFHLGVHIVDLLDLGLFVTLRNLLETVKSTEVEAHQDGGPPQHELEELPPAQFH